MRNNSIYLYLRRLSGHILTLAVAVGLMAGVSACSGPLNVPLTIEGEPDMNSGGNAAVVRLYQLSSATTFEQTPLESFWQDDEAVLEDDLIGSRTSMLLYPGDQEEITIEILDGTRYIGVAADLRDPDGDRWRATYTLDEVRDGGLNIRIGEQRLLVEVRD